MRHRISPKHMAHLEDEQVIRRKLGTLFPDESQRREAERELARYGLESYELEAVRVRLAVLKLGGRDLESVRSLVEAAKEDYRDVLAWAEYPAQMKAGPCGVTPSERTVQARGDREQYEDWLRQ